MRRHRAFTLIELLVVMGIIAIFVMCLLPAFLGAQSASRRLSCVNNLKQISLAIQGYLTSYNVLPSGSAGNSAPVSSVPDGQEVSWIVSLLPYLEQTALSRAFDPRYGANHPANQTVAMSRLRTLLCPSEGGPSFNYLFGVPTPSGQVSPGQPPAGGRTSYAGCHHDVEAPISGDNNGVFFLNSRVRVVDVSDGLAQTIFVGELPLSSSLGWVSGTRASLRNTGHPINGMSRQAVEQATPGPPPLPADCTAFDLEQMIASGERKIAPTFVGGFGSAHPGGGANFALGDGSVRFIKQTIDQAVYQRLGNRADGELIDGEAY
jgi:prepilin-type N-terminal cleavage/methylation domain-containing protein/prepilin-type processing-associated H-X9-DG protein